jgi:hypothetical protein
MAAVLDVEEPYGEPAGGTGGDVADAESREVAVRVGLVAVLDRVAA